MDVGVPMGLDDSRLGVGRRDSALAGAVDAVLPLE